MEIFTTIQALQKRLKKENSQTIGFVPTMGALHAGHISLVKESRKKCNLTVVSIFINPTQFAPTEDLSKYPHPLEQDKKLLRKEKVDILFLPGITEIYPNTQEDLPYTFEATTLPNFTKILEGASRPSHFAGVAQIVKILFEVVCPTDAFFGQKDYQQTLLVKWLINKCKFKIRLHVCPIVRTSDGLALSSRNLYLNPKERKNALILRQTLHLAQSLIQKGENDVLKIENAMRKYIAKEKTVVLDYAVIRNQNDLSQQKNINQTSIALIVVKFGMTRLLDNMLLKT